MIVVLDSGVGGLPYLDAIRLRDPTRELLYVADSAGFPYGPKPPDVVQTRVLALAAEVERRWPVALFVIACNTASVIALQALRASVAAPCVGVVPAIKPAVGVTRSGRISLLSTDRTADSGYTIGLIDRFAAGLAVQRVGSPELVEYAEHALSDPRPHASHAIDAVVARIRGHRSDVVVLACTHFVVIKAELQAALGSEVTVLDSVDGVARRVTGLLGDRGTTDRSATAQVSLLHTGRLAPHVHRSAAAYRVAALEPIDASL